MLTKCRFTFNFIDLYSILNLLPGAEHDGPMQRSETTQLRS